MTGSQSEFEQPPSEREVLRFGLKNILTDYAEDHPGLPFDSEDPDLETLTGHRTNFGGNYSQLVSRLTNRFDDTSFQVNSDDHLDIKDLQEALEKPSASYPLVEVHPELYEYQAESENSPEEYIVQRGQYGASVVPLLIPFSIEEESVFYYDPFLGYYTNGTNTGQQISRGLFIELWGRCDLTSWALWVDQGQQRTLMDITEAET